METKKPKYDILDFNDGHENIRYGIVTQAIKDYKRALRRNDKGQAIALERWFLSAWGQMLSGHNGTFIIEQVRKETKQNGL